MNSSSKSDLRVDWVTHAAAKYACEHWHYSGCVPKSKQVWIGVWEDNRFIGIVSIGRSSTPYLGNSFNLETTECAELTRIALRTHRATVTKIMAITIKMIKKQSPGLRLLISLADSMQGHYGTVYQAGNWIYVGRSSARTQYYFREKWRNDTPLMRYLKANPTLKSKLETRRIEGKHKYLMPLDREMRAKILPLAQPYPKRPKQATSETIGEAAGQNRPGRSK